MIERHFIRRSRFLGTTIIDNPLARRKGVLRVAVAEAGRAIK
jgi:hypothetical protein